MLVEFLWLWGLLPKYLWRELVAQTWDPEKKWREISWIRTYFWSIVCYHSYILNSYSKFKERETQFLSFSLFSLTLFFEISFCFFSLPPSPSSLCPLFFFIFLFWLFCYLYMCFNIFFLSLFLLGSRSFSCV